MFLLNILLHHRANIYQTLSLAAFVVFLGTLFLRPEEHKRTPSLRRESQLVLILFKKIKVFLPPMVIQTMVIGTITPFGKISDRIRRLPLLTIAFLISSLSILSLAECHTWGKALIPSTFFGASLGAVFPAWNALFLNSVPI